MTIAETYLKDKELNKKIDAKHKQRYVEGRRKMTRELSMKPAIPIARANTEASV